MNFLSEFFQSKKMIFVTQFFEAILFNPHGIPFRPQDMIIELFLWRVNQRSRCCRGARLIFPLVKVKATVAKIIRLSQAAQKLLYIFKQSVAIQRREIHLHCFLEHKESTVWVVRGQGVRRLTLLFPFLGKLQKLSAQCTNYIESKVNEFAEVIWTGFHVTFKV